MNTNTKTQRYANAIRSSWLLSAVAWILCLGLFTALCYVGWVNIAPYVAIASTFNNTQNWVLKLPLIGSLVNSWGNFINVLVGVLIWAVVQILQCMWLLIRLDRQAMSGALHQTNVNRQALKDAVDDDPETKQIKQQTRKIPIFFIRYSGYLALGAYVFDCVVGVSLYPPAKSLGSFLMAISVGNWRAIDGSNLIRLSIMLFAFEFVLVMLLIAAQWATARTEQEERFS